MEQLQAITIVDIMAIIISIVALIITVIGFFASLKFYRDGVKLQGIAHEALVKIEEKTYSIQSQVGGMFEKTLDAAIGKADKLSDNVEALNEQFETAAKAITESALAKIDSVGEGDRQQFVELIKKQIEPIREQIQETRKSADDIIDLTRISLKESSRQINWKDFITFVASKNRAMANILGRGLISFRDNNRVEIQLEESKTFFSTYFEDPEHYKNLVRYCHQYFNNNEIKVNVVNTI